MKKIFIGSSSKYASLEKAHTIALMLRNMGADTVFWRDDEAFPLSHNTLENLIKMAHSCSGGVFIFDKDEEAISSDHNGNRKYIPRDNVIAEAGMFAGVLGKEAVVICSVPGVHEISDFKGITYLIYDLENKNRLENQLKRWLDQDVKDYRIPKSENNLLMLSRHELHSRYTIDEQFHINDGLYKHIRRIRIMNFASVAIFCPKINKTSLSNDYPLSDVIEKIMKETSTDLELILTEPNENNLSDLETKISNRYRGSVDGVLYSALSGIYDNLSQDTVYKDAYEANRFHFYIIKISMPFGIFNVEFSQEYKQLNHVKVDLYSAGLSHEDNRRSFIVWQEDAPENYNFFVNTFNTNKLDPRICGSPDMQTLKSWADCWEEINQ